jgi:CheY-like chemotaxis protein
VKSLVDAHGGSVAVHSAGQDRGATFVVRLPLAVPDAVPVVMEASTAARDRSREVPSLKGLTVLMVDDDRESREVVAAHLNGCGAAVLTAASAAEAFDMLQRQHVSVLLADIGMPEEDGYALIRRIRALSAPHVAAIPAGALTAFARDEDRQEALNAGFQLHLAKPVDALSLATAVAMLSRMEPTAGGSPPLRQQFES